MMDKQIDDNVALAKAGQRLKRAVVVVTIWVALASSAFAQQLPWVKTVSAPLVTPANAIAYYSAQPSTHTVGVAAPSAAYPEIVELARALGASRYTASAYAETVYEYVRNNIAIEFRFGLSKGGRGALIDQSGTAFDQADLMIQLLQQAGISATYQVGVVTLTPAQFLAWSGFSASGVSNAAAICQYLADGGIPATVNGMSSCSALPANTSLTSVTMLHVWVLASSVSPVTLYDPAYKVQIQKTGINLAGAMGCPSGSASNCASTILGLIPQTTQTCGVAGVNCVTNVNRPALESQLTTYASNLQHTIQNSYNNPHSTYLALGDVIGGLSIDTTQPTNTGTLLPTGTGGAYGTSTYSWPSGEIPDAFRTTLTVQFDQINQLLFADETAGNRLQMWGYADQTASNSVPTTQHYALYSEYRVIARSDQPNSSGQLETLQLVVHHPYAANSGTYASETISTQLVALEPDCYYDPGQGGTVCTTNVMWHTNVINIIQGFGDQGQSTVTHYADLQRRDKLNGVVWENPSDPRNIQVGIQLHVSNKRDLGVACTSPSAESTNNPDLNPCYELQESSYIASWLAETTRARAVAGTINGVAIQNHHSLGIGLAGDFVIPATILSVQTTLSADSVAASSADQNAAFLGLTATMNRLEGGVFEQSDFPLDGGAGLSLMIRANDNQVPFLDVNAGNVNAVNAVLSDSVNNWFASDLTNLSNYASSNAELIVPLNGWAGSFALDNGTWTFEGTGVAAFGADNAHIAFLATMNGLFLKGSSGAPTADPTNEIEQAIRVPEAAVKKRKLFSVNAASGALDLTPAPDLVTGDGAFPYSLAYQRVYDPSSIGFTITSPEANYYAIFPTEPAPSDLGGGWTHTLSIKARIGSDAFAGFGRDGGLEAVDIIAGALVQRWLALGITTSSTPQFIMRTRLADIFTTHWMVNNLNRNVVVVSRPPATNTFVALPDLSFDPGPGSAEVLTQTGSQSLAGFAQGWVWNSTGVSFSLQAKDGSVLNLAQSLPSTGVDTPYPYPANYIFVPTTWTFPTGVVVSFSYNNTDYMMPWYQACLLQVSNNLGRSLTFNDPCSGPTLQSVTTMQLGNVGTSLSVQDDAGRHVSFSYSPAAGVIGAEGLPPSFVVTGADGGITSYNYTVPTSGVARPAAGISQIYTPLSTSVPYLTVSYDSLFRVERTTDDSQPTGFTTNYFVSGMFGIENQKRSDVVDPLGAINTTYFDQWNHQTQTINALNYATTYYYDSAHRLTKTIHPEGDTEVRSYDTRSNQLSVTHNPVPGSTLAATVSSTSYMEGPTVFPCVMPATCNQAATTTDADNHTTSYVYLSTGTGQVERITGPAISSPPSGAIAGQVTGQSQTDYCYSTQYGSTGTVSLLVGTIEKADATNSRVKAFTYNAGNDWTLLSSVVDPTTTYVPPLTVGGACTSTTKSNALALTTQYVFDAGTAGSGPGNVSSITDPDTHATAYKFDAMRRLTTITPPASTFAFTRYCYDLDGELLSTNKWRSPSAPSDPNSGTATTTGQCAASYPTSAWEIESRTYFPTGDLETVADTAGNTTTYAYDPDGRKQVVQDPVGRQSATLYDLAGQVLAQWRGGSNWINASTGLPVLSNIPTSWNPSNYAGTGPVLFENYCNGTPQAQSQNCYSANGKALYAIDADNHVTQYQYDGFDRLRISYFPDPTTGTLCSLASSDGALPTCTGQQTYELSTFDPVGNRMSLLTRRGDTIGYQYDAANHEIIKSPTGQGAVSSGLDLLGEPYTLTKAANGSLPSHTTIYTYDAAGRKNTESNDGLSVGYAYDGVGNRTKTTWPDGYYVSYAYDPLNRMQYVRENSTTTNELAYYVYDPLSRRSSLCMGAGSNSCSTTAWTNEVMYGYEPLDGQLNALSHTLNTTTVSLAYTRNAAYQIQNLSASDAFYLPSPTTATSTSYAPNALNEYATVAGNTYKSDLNGNLLSWTPPGGSSVQTDTYDSENRLTSAVYGTTTDTFDYDALGRRVAKTYNGVTTLYLHDADEEIAEYSGSALSSGTLMRRYVTGPAVDDRITHIESGSTSPPVSAHTYYHVNHQGSVIDMTDNAGNVSGGVAAGQRLAYDEYGNLSSAANGTGEQFRYTGRRYDAEVGLYYYRARYYSPQIGRFLQTDPIGYKDDVDLYTYVGNDPLDKTDPRGEQAFSFGFVPEEFLPLEELTAPADQVIGPKGKPLTPLEKLPPGSAGGPGAKKDFPYSPKPDNPPPCEYCGEDTTKEPGPNQHNNDHRVPKKQDGNNTDENHADSCRTCNLSKGGRTPAQWYDSLKNAIRAFFGLPPAPPPPPPPPEHTFIA